MDYRYVIYENDGNIAKVTLNRPDKLNAFGLPRDPIEWEGKQLWLDFHAALDEAENDDEIKEGKDYCVIYIDKEAKDDGSEMR